MSARVKVAVVDDDASVRKALCRLFGELDMDARAFASGQDFIESLEQAVPDLVVLDVRMPHTNAWDVMDELREKAAHAKTILISADDELSASAFQETGAVAFLIKPIDEDSLLAALQKKDLQDNPGTDGGSIVL